ncbi:hypothetical protein MAUB1S_02907 [Mycolicibacterium aubagnense]
MVATFASTQRTAAQQQSIPGPAAGRRPVDRNRTARPSQVPIPGTIQPKLTTGAVNDPLEHEADRVADHVMRMAAAAPLIAAAPQQVSRSCASCQENPDHECDSCERESAGQIQKKPMGAARPAPAEAPPSVGGVLSQPGQPMNAATRSFFEPRFGHDFSDVRIHTDHSAAESAREIGARAYTVGRHIAFGTSSFAPSTDSGRRLIAHELAHVIQQQGGRAAIVRREDSGAGGAPPVGTGAEGSSPGSGGSRQTSRAVNEDEKKNAAIIFGDSLNLDGISITESRIMSFGAGFGPYARTLPHTVYVWPGELDESTHMLLMMHEFTHLWQYQHGIGVATTTYNAVKGNYDFGGEDGLRKAWASCKHFRDFNTEQQGDICQAYWRAKTGGKDTSAYAPYIDEVQNGGMPGQCDQGQKGGSATA